jgi:Ethylbenzene dehydrogenase
LTNTAWLPTGEVWTLHLAAGLVLTGLGVGYALYALRSGISARLSTRRVRTLAQGKVEGARWGAVAVSLHWTLFAALAIQGVTGVLLYLGHGGWVVTAYLAGAVAVLGYIGVHVVSHIGYGGWRHLLRILRPAPAPGYWRRRRPLLIGGVAAVAASGTVVAIDLAGRDVLDMLPVETVRTAPALHGRLDDEAWRGAKPVVVRTHQGANLGGTGEATVEIRAVRTEGRIHFAFRWSDPTRSLRHLPLVKREDGWHLVHGRYDIQDETLSYEDKVLRGQVLGALLAHAGV